jgi:hypothetical protein
MEKNNIEKYFALGLTTILIFLMLQPIISSHSSSLIPTICTQEKENIVIFKGISSNTVEDFSTSYAYKKTTQPIALIRSGTNVQLTNNTYYDGHPTITSDGLGNLMVNYERGDQNQSMNIGMRISQNGGATWDNHSYYWTIPYKETRPDIDYVGSQRTAIGSLVPDPTFSDGSVATFIVYPDIIDPYAEGRWSCSGGDLTTHNITHMTSTAVGGYVGDPKPDPKFKGIWAYTADFGTRHTVVLCSHLPQGYRTCVFPDLEGDVDNISADVDISTGKMVLTMDDNNDINGPGILILTSYIGTDWNWWSVVNGSYIKGYKNPDIMAINGTIYIVAQKAGKIYSLISNSTTGSYNVKTVSDQGGYPTIATNGQVIHCLAIDNGNLNLYKLEVGKNWTFVKQINTVDGTVTEGYKTSDICGEGITWTDMRDDNSNIYFESYIFGQKINIDNIKGGFGCSVTITNIFNSQMTGIPWTISFDGKIFIGQEKTGTIDTLTPGETGEIRSGFIFGLGRATIIVKVEQAIASAKCFVIGPFIFLIK